MVFNGGVLMVQFKCKYLFVAFAAMFTCTMLFCTSSGEDQFIKFLDRYSCSEEIEAELGNQDIIAQALRVDSSADKKFYFKGCAIDRLVNAIRVQRFIDDQKLDSMGVAQKCWSKKLQQVVSVGVADVDKDRQPSLPEVQQFVKVAQGTGFADWHNGNVLYIKNKRKYIIVDTEEQSFSSPMSCLCRLIDTFNFMQIDPQALAWLQQNAEELVKQACDKKVPHLGTRQYDDHDIDFNQVKDISIQLHNAENNACFQVANGDDTSLFSWPLYKQCMHERISKSIQATKDKVDATRTGLATSSS